MTPEEFLAEVKRIYANHSTGGAHERTDVLMESLLTSLGYQEGVEFLAKQEKWYE